MEKNHVKGFEQVIIDYAKKEDLSPDVTISDCQSALLNIAGWVCKCLGYSNQQYEKFMREYAANVNEAIDSRFGKE